MQNTVSPIKLFRDAYSKLLARKDLLGWYIVFTVGLPLVFYFLGVEALPGFFDFIYSVVQVLVTTSLFYCVAQNSKNESFWDGFGWAIKNIIPIVIIDLLYLLTLIFGAILFIVPSILVLFYLSLAFPVFVIEGRRNFTALTRSADLVRGSEGWFLLRSLAVFVPSLIFVAIGGVLGSVIPENISGMQETILGSIFMLLKATLEVFFIFCIVEIVSILRARKPEFDPSSYEGLKQTLVIGVILAIIVIPLLFVFVLPFIALAVSGG